MSAAYCSGDGCRNVNSCSRFYTRFRESAISFNTNFHKRFMCYRRDEYVITAGYRIFPFRMKRTMIRFSKMYRSGVDTDWRTGSCREKRQGKDNVFKAADGEMEYSGTIIADAGFDYFPYPVAERQLDTTDAMYCVEPGLLLWKLKKDMGRTRCG